mmetsp:Transcript_342/g.396  ORF Transcript_342/g.396 Transcript_342/m.396 type:complete len:107 (-) Transcript_342:155-475(-)
MPSGNILISETRSHIEHNNSALSVNIVAVTKTTEFLLTSSIPAVETDLTPIGGEIQRTDLNTNSGFVLLFKLTSDVALHKSSLTRSTIADKNKLEVRNTVRGNLSG